MITKGKFGSYDLYTLDNGILTFSVCTYGATWTCLDFRGTSMIKAYPTPEAMEEGKGYICKGVGRYANRIGGAAFDLEGKHYVLPANEGKNQLHGGPGSYDSRVWDAEILQETDEKGETQEKLKLSIFSPDGDCGFPGNLTMGLIFSLKKESLFVEFTGETDATTVFAPTVHPYFNLNGSNNILHGGMRIMSTGHLEVDSELIPTGKIISFKPSELRTDKFNFNSYKTILDDFDDAFVCPEEFCCILAMRGYQMEVHTDFPALQIYTGSRMPAPFKPNEGVAIEPEFFPDSPNHPEFPSTVLRPGEHFKKYVEYRFYRF